MSGGLGWLEKLRLKKQLMLEQMDRGRVVTEQMKAERLRRRSDKLFNMKPGARKAIVEGLKLHKSPLQVMKDEYDRRKFEREK
jgi:hypothetical protein